MLRALLALSLLACVMPARANSTAPSDTSDPDPVLINITEGDLNRILHDAFLASGGPRFAGNSSKIRKGASDLRYRANLSEPVLRLEDGGRARLSFEILEAELQIGRLEHRLLRSQAYCENAGLALDPENPVDVELALRFAIEQGGLRIVPEAVRLSDSSQDMRLLKPTRCGHALLPGWLLWRLGKPQLKRQVGKLDDILLARAQRSSVALNGDAGLMRGHWSIEPLHGSEAVQEINLEPRHLETRHGSLLLGLAAAADAHQGDGSPLGIERVPGLSSRTFLGLSESFLTSLAAMAFPASTSVRHIPGGNLEKILASRSFHGVAPGLRHISPKNKLSFELRFERSPAIELAAIDQEDLELEELEELEAEGAVQDSQRVMLRVLLSGIELRIWETRQDEEVLLGSLSISAGRLGVVPFANRLGGVSFEVVENDWELASSGVEINAEALAALIQELVFGEMFGTRLEPLAREPFTIGDTEFAPRRFRLLDHYLIVELSGS